MAVDKRILDKYLNRQRCEKCCTCMNYQNEKAGTLFELYKYTVDNVCADCEDGSNYVGV